MLLLLSFLNRSLSSVFIVMVASARLSPDFRFCSGIFIGIVNSSVYINWLLALFVARTQQRLLNALAFRWKMLSPVQVCPVPVQCNCTLAWLYSVPRWLSVYSSMEERIRKIWSSVCKANIFKYRHFNDLWVCSVKLGASISGPRAEWLVFKAVANKNSVVWPLAGAEARLRAWPDITSILKNSRWVCK